MTSTAIRNAVIDDARPVGELITELGYATTTEQMTDRLATLLDDPNSVTLVAVTDRDVVGVAASALSWYYEKDGRYARLLVLAVSPTSRGLGIGGQLVGAIERWAAANGARELFLNSGLHREAAHRFYEGCGYSRTGFRFVKDLSHSLERNEQM